MDYQTTTMRILKVLLILALVSAGLSLLVQGAAPPGQDKRITFTGGRKKEFCGVSEMKDIRCDKPPGDSRNEFFVEDLMDGTYALKSASTGQYCHDQGNRVVCHSDVVGNHEKFHWIDRGGSGFALTGPKSGTKRHYCADEKNGIVCNRPRIGSWELYNVQSTETVPQFTSDNDGFDDEMAQSESEPALNLWQWFFSWFY